MPRVSELDTLRSEGEITGLFQKSTRLISILSLGIGSALFALSWQLLFLWLGESFALNTITAFRWLIVIYSLLGVSTVAYFVVMDWIPTDRSHRGFRRRDRHDHSYGPAF